MIQWTYSAVLEVDVAALKKNRNVINLCTNTILDLKKKFQTLPTTSAACLSWYLERPKDERLEIYPCDFIITEGNR
jgi:hypothetical protein